MEDWEIVKAYYQSTKMFGEDKAYKKITEDMKKFFPSTFMELKNSYLRTVKNRGLQGSTKDDSL